jgi:membrane-associated protease RseP (regulator of RpoE activity)
VSDATRTADGTPSAGATDTDHPGVDATGDGYDQRGPGTAGPAEARGSLLQLIAIVAVVVLAAVVTHTTNLLVVVVAIIAMVMIHELGHFATAKWSHMKVTEYFLGFGPRLWSIRRGETEYGIKAIPAGGYVKIVGMSNTEVVDPVDEPRTYRQQPFHNRLMVALAGSFMHLVMAFVLLWGLLTFIGQPQSDTSVAGFSSVTHGLDPARAAGLHVGDDIVSIDGRAVTDGIQLQHIIETHAGVPLSIVVERGHPVRTVTLTATPVVAPGGNAKDSARIGIEIGAASVTVAPFHALGTTGVDIGRIVTGTLSALGTTFSPHGLSSFFGQLGNTKAADAAAQAGTRPESILGAVRTATQGAQNGVYDLGLVLVEIILAVGMINLFPMLPLDGGHVLVAVYERIRSRKGRPYRADITKLIPVASAFVLFLVIFVAAAVFLDITHPIANPFR